MAAKTNKHPYKAVLFDLDGVLVDMPKGHYEALNRALALFGARIEENEHEQVFNGLPTRKKLEELERQGRLPEGLREFINTIKQQYTKEVIPTYCTPDYSKILLLQHLKKRGLKLGCCSNSVRETLHFMLECSQLKPYLDVIIGNDEVTHPKPHPEIYLRAFDLLGLKPEESLIVEDAPHGIAAAKASGARVLEVRGIQDVNLALFEPLL